MPQGSAFRVKAYLVGKHRLPVGNAQTMSSLSCLGSRGRAYRGRVEIAFS